MVCHGGHKPWNTAIKFRQQNTNLNKLAIKVKGQGEICSLLFDVCKTHRRVKLHQNMTSSFQIIGNFFKVKSQGQTSPESNHF